MIPQDTRAGSFRRARPRAGSTSRVGAVRIEERDEALHRRRSPPWRVAAASRRETAAPCKRPLRAAAARRERGSITDASAAGSAVVAAAAGGNAGASIRPSHERGEVVAGVDEAARCALDGAAVGAVRRAAVHVEERARGEARRHLRHRRGASAASSAIVENAGMAASGNPGVDAVLRDDRPSRRSDPAHRTPRSRRRSDRSPRGSPRSPASLLRIFTISTRVSPTSRSPMVSASGGSARCSHRNVLRSQLPRIAMRSPSRLALSRLGCVSRPEFARTWSAPNVTVPSAAGAGRPKNVASAGLAFVVFAVSASRKLAPLHAKSPVTRSVSAFMSSSSAFDQPAGGCGGRHERFVAEPLLEERIEEDARFRIGEHRVRSLEQPRRRVERARRGGIEQLGARSASPDCERQPRRELVRLERRKTVGRAADLDAEQEARRGEQRLDREAVAIVHVGGDHAGAHRDAVDFRLFERTAERELSEAGDERRQAIRGGRIAAEHRRAPRAVRHELARERLRPIEVGAQELLVHHRLIGGGRSEAVPRVVVGNAVEVRRSREREEILEREPVFELREPAQHARARFVRVDVRARRGSRARRATRDAGAARSGAVADASRGRTARPARAARTARPLVAPPTVPAVPAAAPPGPPSSPSQPSVADNASARPHVRPSAER